MKIGIVILNYNNYDLSIKLVEKCLSISIINKIVLIDNNSSDDFTEYIKNNKDNRIYYLKNKNNCGYAMGNNIGLKYLYDNKCNIGFIANPDVDFEFVTIKKISEFLVENKNYAVCGCKRTVWENGKTRQYWYIPSFKTSLFESLYLGRKTMTKKIESESLKAISDNLDYIDVEVVPGAFFGMNLDIINEVDYLDENTFLWYEENILAYKIKKNNYKEAILLNCSYRHNHEKSTKKNNKLAIFMKSKHYYCYNILNINIFQKILLFVFEKIGLIEQFFINCVLKVLKR